MGNFSNLFKLTDLQPDPQCKFKLKLFDFQTFIIILLCICSSSANILSQSLTPKISKDAVLVVSGGGARGAWGAGISKAIDSLEGFNYKYAVGTSTGALLAPFIAIKEFNLMKEMYTGLGAKKGAVLRPKLYNKKGSFTLRSQLRAAFKKKSISSSKPLLTLLKNGLTLDRYNKIKDQGIEVEVSAIGLELGNVRFRSSNDTSRIAFIEWMWASSNQPAFMTPHIKIDTFKVYSTDTTITFTKKQKHKFNTEIIQTIDIGNGVFEHVVGSKINWVDGGAMENIPILRALEKTGDPDLKEVIIIVNNKAPQQIYQTQSATIVPFVDKKISTTPDLDYSKMADKIIAWVQSLSPIEQNNIQLDTVYDKFLNIKPSRMSNKVDLNILDIQRLIEVSTSKAASFDSDVFKIKKKKLEKKMFRTKTVIDKILATIDAFSKETFMNDILGAIQSDKAEGKKFRIFFMPLKMYELNPASLNFNEKNMDTLYTYGAKFDYNPATIKSYSEYFQVTFPDGETMATLVDGFIKTKKDLEDAIMSKNKIAIITSLREFDDYVTTKILI